MHIMVYRHFIAWDPMAFIHFTGHLHGTCLQPAGCHASRQGVYRLQSLVDDDYRTHPKHLSPHLVHTHTCTWVQTMSWCYPWACWLDRALGCWFSHTCTLVDSNYRTNPKRLSVCVQCRSHIHTCVWWKQVKLSYVLPSMGLLTRRSIGLLIRPFMYMYTGWQHLQKMPSMDLLTRHIYMLTRHVPLALPFCIWLQLTGSVNTWYGDPKLIKQFYQVKASRAIVGPQICPQVDPSFYAQYFHRACQGDSNRNHHNESWLSTTITAHPATLPGFEWFTPRVCYACWKI